MSSFTSCSGHHGPASVIKVSGPVRDWARLKSHLTQDSCSFVSFLRTVSSQYKTPQLFTMPTH